ncbi:hypothetical protein BJY04DRAFT_216515 [Aspergillus karnatakaensis]|uniref:BTB/POZ domain-containing protein n=1 Tax=Aspergillus karnatakaensis TaxID=1810916 RepID=UPI003CCD2664
MHRPHRPSAKLRELAKSGRFSDLIIDCGNHQLRVHRAIVCPELKFIDKLVRESSEDEKESRIKLDEDPRVIGCILAWCYSINYAREPAPFPGLTSETATLHPGDYVALLLGGDNIDDPARWDAVQEVWGELQEDDQELRELIAGSLACRYGEIQSSEKAKRKLDDTPSLAAAVRDSLEILDWWERSRAIFHESRASKTNQTNVSARSRRAVVNL